MAVDDFCTEYAEKVLDGRIISGPHVRDACKRHLKDLEKAPQRGFFFDVERANWVVDYFRHVLCLNGGDFEGKPFEPELWQRFIIGCLFGWVNADGYRRFRVAYVETGKGSGKSPLAAGIGMYGLTADGESRAEIYAAATKKDQAMVLFRDAVAMFQLSPELNSRLIPSGVGEKIWNLAYLEEGSFFKPISADDGQSGPRPHIALLDEIHEHKTSNVVEMMRAGTKGRRQALIFMITNSGFDKNSVCWHYHDYAAKVCSGQLEDDSFFGYVCALDEGDEPFQDESCWPKANPSLGVTIPYQYLREQVTQARGMPSKESIVRRLNFCQWVGASNPWLSAEIWFPAADDYTFDDLKGRRCVGGLDLSSTQDLTAFVLLFYPTESDPYYRLWPMFWLPEEGLKKKGELDGVDYLTWVKTGHLMTTPGRAINKRYVAQHIAEMVSFVNCENINFDRWRIEDFKEKCADEGIKLPLNPFGQGYKDMAPAVEEFERLLIDGKLKHNKNPCMTWNAANVVLLSDPTGSRKPAKDKSTGRIDGIVGGIMAVGGTLIPPKNKPSIYQQRGILTV